MTAIALADLPQTARAALERLAPKTDAATVVTLRGDLGAGKTTFVQALARELGVAEAVQSPTYVLMKSYPIARKGFTKLVHIDAYRLDAPEQFLALRPDEFLSDPESLICIEWPERLEGMLPKPDLELEFSSEAMAAGERRISIV
ncbi:MAG TPA: tRNA (adenosine(37)-N6)-threonylcarbamoyltransferase complex ATPase subunit type 1 TsaE [Candidatus Paceibacterota bacterium]|nr:tRNA (adenosine(37)-N6)-threonylcarbamoyltransferase complex ATPase subunit type 1 TsaE [Candidatus Paceibacterota bacterium]